MRQGTKVGGSFVPPAALRVVGVAVLMTVVSWLGVPAIAQAPAPRPIDDPEAYAVYASLIPSHWVVLVANASRLVFVDEASTEPERCMPSGELLETDDWLPVVEDFKSENAEPRAVLPGRNLGIPYVVVSREEVRQIMGFGWTNFYDRFPQSGGSVYVSAVGFDAAKERAMVYMGNFCGSECGEERFYFLEKVAGSWREAKLPGVKICWVMY